MDTVPTPRPQPPSTLDHQPRWTLWFLRSRWCGTCGFRLVDGGFCPTNPERLIWGIR